MGQKTSRYLHNARASHRQRHIVHAVQVVHRYHVYMGEKEYWSSKWPGGCCLQLQMQRLHPPAAPPAAPCVAANRKPFLTAFCISLPTPGCGLCYHPFPQAPPDLDDQLEPTPTAITTFNTRHSLLPRLFPLHLLCCHNSCMGLKSPLPPHICTRWADPAEDLMEEATNWDGLLLYHVVFTEY